jgi:hypothetical protein
LVVSVNVFAVTPESNVVQRLAAIVANVTNGEVDTAAQDDQDKLDRIAQRFSSNFQDEFDAFVADQQNPTNAEYASFVILKVREYGRDVLRREAESEALATQNAPITTAGETAAQDLEAQ